MKLPAWCVSTKTSDSDLPVALSTTCPFRLAPPLETKRATRRDAPSDPEPARADGSSERTDRTPAGREPALPPAPPAPGSPPSVGDGKLECARDGDLAYAVSVAIPAPRTTICPADASDFGATASGAFPRSLGAGGNASCVGSVEPERRRLSAPVGERLRARLCSAGATTDDSFVARKVLSTGAGRAPATSLTPARSSPNTRRRVAVAATRPTAASEDTKIHFRRKRLGRRSTKDKNQSSSFSWIATSLQGTCVSGPFSCKHMHSIPSLRSIVSGWNRLPANHLL